MGCGFLILLTLLRLGPRELVPPWVWVVNLFVFLAGLFWANAILTKRNHPVWAALLTLLLVPILGIPIGIGSIWISRCLAEWNYKTHGVVMVEGCNAAAANNAAFEADALVQRLAALSNNPAANSNQLAQLRDARALAQEQARFLDNDCFKRGHCENHPWKTNWAVISKTLTNFEESRTPDLPHP